MEKEERKERELLLAEKRLDVEEQRLDVQRDWLKFEKQWLTYSKINFAVNIVSRILKRMKYLKRRDLRHKEIV